MTERRGVATGAQQTARDGLAEVFDTERPRLHAIAYRLLGSHWDADDAVQEAWIRLQNSDVRSIENLGAWLTTVVSRISLDQCRRAATRYEDLGAELPDEVPGAGAELPGARTELPEAAAMSGEEVAAALTVVLDQLSPLERVAFVLHDVFGLPFADIAPVVERTPQAARQLASRARRRVARVDAGAEQSRRHDAVDAFLSAARNGDFGRLLQILDPEIRVRADQDALAASTPFVAAGAPQLAPSLHGADAVARAFAGRAAMARAALLDGVPGAVYSSDGVVKAAYLFRLRGHRVAQIEVIGNPDRIAALVMTEAAPTAETSLT